jgi:hypothetical protein
LNIARDANGHTTDKNYSLSVIFITYQYGLYLWPHPGDFRDEEATVKATFRNL